MLLTWTEFTVIWDLKPISYILLNCISFLKDYSPFSSKRTFLSPNPLLFWLSCWSLSWPLFLKKQKKTKKKKKDYFSKSTAHSHSVFGVLPFNIWTSLKLKFILVKCALLKQFWKQIRNKFGTIDTYFFVLLFFFVLQLFFCKLNS